MVCKGVMSKAKWFVVRKRSAVQVPHQINVVLHVYSLGGLKESLGLRLTLAQMKYLHDHYTCIF